MSLAGITSRGFFDPTGAAISLYDLTVAGFFNEGATSTAGVIDNHHLATLGWYQNEATEMKVPDGEEIHGWGLLDGTIASTAAGEEKHVRKGMRWWILFDKRYRRHT